MKPNKIRILIADDHRLFRRALIRLIQTFNLQIIIHEAENGKQALAAIRTKSYDVILLDIQMPILSGIEVMKEVQKQEPLPKVIVVTQFIEHLMISYLLQLGVFGFLNKNCDPKELKTGILTVASGNYYFNTEAKAAIESNIKKERRSASIAMSKRELEVMSLLKDGKSNKEISTTLRLSLRTIESYRKALMKKTNCHNVAELVRLAYRTGITVQ